MRIGRNDPCPCGSGKKYKKCCLGKADDVYYSNPVSYTHLDVYKRQVHIRAIENMPTNPGYQYLSQINGSFS